MLSYKPASEKENKKMVGPTVNLHSQTLPLPFCFHQNLHTRVARFLSEELRNLRLSSHCWIIQTVYGNSGREAELSGFGGKRDSQVESG